MAGDAGDEGVLCWQLAGHEVGVSCVKEHLAPEMNPECLWVGVPVLFPQRPHRYSLLSCVWSARHTCVSLERGSLSPLPLRRPLGVLN